jgi:hypothetical protein
MVYMAKMLASANEVFAPTNNFAPNAVLDMFEGANTVGEAAAMANLVSVLPAEQQQPMADFLETIPPAIDAAIMAATRDALGRGLRVTFTWQPGAHFELRVWDVTKLQNGEWHGMVNVHITSPEPPEVEPA